MSSAIVEMLGCVGSEVEIEQLQ
jgi:hypothetical protein